MQGKTETAPSEYSLEHQSSQSVNGSNAKLQFTKHNNLVLKALWGLSHFFNQDSLKISEYMKQSIPKENLQLESYTMNT